MSRPREVIAGRSYLITRRCSQRQLLMRPDNQTNNAFIYCLAVAAERYEVDVLFTTAMSNHHHTGIYDRHGNYPAFLECFHKLFAKCQNALRGRWENFWSSEQTSVVRLVGREDVLEKLIYTVCNPVEAGLVEHARKWPGVNSLSAMLEGRALTAQRPDHFFRPDGPMPESASLTFMRPEEFTELSAEDWTSLVGQHVTAKERQYRNERVEDGQRPLGVQGILKQSWRSHPKCSESRRAMSPRVAARNKWRRVEALLQNKVFQKAYRAARAALQAGKKKVLFPHGTYWLRRFAQISCLPE